MCVIMTFIQIMFAYLYGTVILTVALMESRETFLLGGFNF